MTNDPIRDAIAFADQPEQAGNAYHLAIRMAGDPPWAALKARVIARHAHSYALQRRTGFEGDVEIWHEVFVNPAHVAWVEVIWL